MGKQKLPTLTYNSVGRALGIRASTIRDRLRAGWPLKEALTPNRSRHGCRGERVTDLRVKGEPEFVPHVFPKLYDLHKREYTTWCAMKHRCLNENDDFFPQYGGRGIVVCERWMRFENFLFDMGKAPSGTSLDRINNDGNYEPSNCRWATAKEQANNTTRNLRITFMGKTQTLAQWSQQIGIHHNTLRARIVTLGWSAEKALTQPPQRKESDFLIKEQPRDE